MDKKLDEQNQIVTPEYSRVGVAAAAVRCPTCHRPVDVPVNFSVENLHSISMILWTHEFVIECEHCKTKMVPVIAAFDARAIRWTVSPLPEEKPLIEKPNMMDVSQILRR